MEQTFWNVTGLNLIAIMIQFFQQSILTWGLLDKKPDKKKTVIFVIPFGVFLAAFGAVEHLSGMFTHLGFLILHYYVNVIVWCAGIRYIFKEKWKNAAVTSSITVFLIFVSEDFAALFITQNFDLTVASGLLGYMGVAWLGNLVASICLTWILRYQKISEVYSTFLYEEYGRKGWRICILLLPAIQHSIVYWINEKRILNNSNPVAVLLVFFLVYGVLNYVFRCDMQKKQIAEQNASMQQQELYIQNLESVQREMRLFRHDYKNMMSGIYLQAGEGNLTAVQNFIGQMTEEFDRQVGKKVSQMTQLGNIKIPELKGLLAAKLVQIQRHNIQCSLEVLEPIEKVYMPACDLCRAVGILLDNAAEAVEGMEKPAFTCMFTSSPECITVLVKNPVAQVVPIADIWKEGYSTKGEGRGMGLASYRRIIDSYENTFPYTYEENGIFIQELKIRGGAENDSNLHM